MTASFIVLSIARFVHFAIDLVRLVYPPRKDPGLVPKQLLGEFSVKLASEGDISLAYKKFRSAEAELILVMSDAFIASKSSRTTWTPSTFVAKAATAS